MTLFHFLQQSTFVFARSKVRPRASPSISDEMIPSIVAEDSIALRVYCLLAGESGVIISQPEKHL